MRRMYIHELADWPHFRWNNEALAKPLAEVRHRQGLLIGHMRALGFNLRQEAVLHTLTADVLKSSEIEGEKLDAEQVRSSIARRLGMDIGALKPADLNVEGVVEMMLDATSHYGQPLTADRLFAWHAALFPTGRSGMRKIRIGAWREDSDGRMQKADMDVTRWMEWFLACLGRAIDGAQVVLRTVLAKAKFWERIHGIAINDRQRLVLNKLLDGCEGKLTTTKYAKLTKSSQDTALRDLTYMVEKGVLVRSSEGGRSTSYSLAHAT